MINDFRTILLNRTADSMAGAIGNEYIPPAYQRKPLSGALEAVSRIFFGTTPDATARNWYVHQLLRVVQSSVFASWLTEQDSRITYDLSDSELWDHVYYGGVTEGSDTTANQLYALYNNQYTVGDQMYYKYIATVTDSLEVTVTEKTGSGASSVLDFTVLNNLSSWMRFHTMLFAIQAPGGSGNIGDSWTHYHLYPPKRTIPQILSELQASGVSVLFELFRDGSGGEPFSSFYNAWTGATNPIDTLAAGIVAFTERVRAL